MKTSAALFLPALALGLLGQSAFAQSQNDLIPEGVYSVKLTINSTVSNDVLVLNKVDPAFGGPITGTYSAPGIFSAQVTGTTSPTCGAGVVLDLAFTAVENGKNISVHLESFVNRRDTYAIPGSFDGTAYLENGDTLGDFQADKIADL